VLLYYGLNPNLLSVLAETLETHLAVREREKRVVSAAAYVRTRIYVRAALSHEDIAREHKLAVAALDAEPLGLAVAPVTGTADALLVGEQLQIYF
jgi:hypothetical protein